MAKSRASGLMDVGRNLWNSMFPPPRRHAPGPRSTKIPVDPEEGKEQPPEIEEPVDRIPAGEFGEDEVQNRAMRRLAIGTGSLKGTGSGLLDVVQGLGDAYSSASRIGAGETIKQSTDTAEKLLKVVAASKTKGGRMPAVPPKMVRDLSKNYNDIVQGRKATRIVKRWLEKRQGGKRYFKAQGSNFISELKEEWRRLWGTKPKDQAQFDRAYNSTVNAYIKNMTGAQLSAHEAARLMKAMPDPKASAESFMAVWDDIMQEQDERFRMNVSLANKVGYRGMKGFVGASSEIKRNPHKRTTWKEIKTKSKGSGKGASKRRKQWGTKAKRARYKELMEKKRKGALK